MEKKNYLLIIIIPAIIVGLFGLTPKIYDLIITPKKILNFSIKGGPAIEENGSYRSIFLIEIINNGQTPLCNLNGYIQIVKGNIEKVSIDDSNLQKPRISKGIDFFKISYDRFFPRDRFVISFLIKSKFIKPKIKSVIHTDEIKAVELEKNNNTKKKSYYSIWGALLSGFSVLIMASIALKSKTVRNKISSALSFKKNDILFYISLKTTNLELIRFIKDNKTITYSRVSDLILFQYLLKKDDLLVYAQQSLLLIKNIADTSKKIILCNLEALGSPKLTQRELKKINKFRVEDLLDIRKNIDIIFNNGLKKLIK